MDSGCELPDHDVAVIGAHGMDERIERGLLWCLSGDRRVSHRPDHGSPQKHRLIHGVSALSTPCMDRRGSACRNLDWMCVKEDGLGAAGYPDLAFRVAIREAFDPSSRLIEPDDETG